jgi:hypothetical protein
MRVYHPIMTAPAQAAEGLLGRIEAGDVVHGMKLRDIYNKGWQGLGTKGNALRAAEILEDHGWCAK